MYEIWRSRSSLNPFQRSNRLDGTQSPVYEASTPLGRIHSGTVNFKDISIGPEALETADGDIDDDDRHSEDSTNKSAILLKPPKVPHRTKYVIILVGLPGRGKTFLCNKIKCYLNWLGHHTRHFNVGSYRRLQKGDHEVQTADFFDAHNPAGMEARNRALHAALDDLQSYLYSDAGQVAIFDATNTTVERRRELSRRFHGKFQYLFIESICTDDKVLEQNYCLKMQYSPDYKGMDMQQSLSDFKERIQKYAEVYEPIDDRNIHYIKLIDMVTGRGHMDVNRISGYLPGKIVFFLMQVCKAGMPGVHARSIWLTRHGESEYNLAHRIGGNSPLSAKGEIYARCLPEILINQLDPQPGDEHTCVPVSVWTSTLCRTIQTARYLPFPKLRWKALDEIQAGACDGLTYEEIKKRCPEEYEARKKDKLRYRYPAGESYLDVIQRLEPVIIEMEREKECIVVVGHQAVLRALLGYFMAEPLESIPNLDVPLHTLIELRPRPDGTMEYIPMAPEVAADIAAAMAAGLPPGALDSGNFSGAPSPTLLSPIYSVACHGSPVVNAAAAAASSAAAAAAAVEAPRAVAGSALAAASSTAWSPPKGSGGGLANAAAGTPAPSCSPASVVKVVVPTAAAAVAAATDGVTGASPTISQHSRTPSLTSGMGGGTAPSASGNSPSSGFHFATSPPSGGSAVTAVITAVGGGDAAAAGNADSPSSRAAALVAAAADSRTRKVRVPYGATMGGGGSEGGAPPDVLLLDGLLGSPTAGSNSWSPAGTMQHGLGSSPGSDPTTFPPTMSLLRQMQQMRGPDARSLPEGDEEGDVGAQGEVEEEEEVEKEEAPVAQRVDSEAVAAREVSELEGTVMSLAYLLERTASLVDGTAGQGAGGGDTDARVAATARAASGSGRGAGNSAEGS